MATDEPTPLVSVVIPNYDGAAHLERCLRSLGSQTFPDFEIIVVDNGSRDSSLKVVRQCAPRARIVAQPENLGFASAVNAGARVSRGAWLAVLNNDTEPAPLWLQEAVEAGRRHPEASFVACRIHDDSRRDRLYSAGDCYLRAGIGYRRGQELPVSRRHLEECEVFSACGCAALYRRSVFQEFGGFDERFFAYLEDVDLGLRLQAAGRGGVYAPSAVVYHVGGGTSGGEFSDLAVRLRTRNSVLLILKNLPARMILRSLPMILLAQLFWLGRVVARGRLRSYLRGIAEVLPRARGMRQHVTSDSGGLWGAVFESESQARHDVAEGGGDVSSSFLKWYFRLF